MRTSTTVTLALFPVSISSCFTGLDYGKKKKWMGEKKWMGDEIENEASTNHRAFKVFNYNCNSREISKWAVILVVEIPWLFIYNGHENSEDHLPYKLSTILW